MFKEKSRIFLYLMVLSILMLVGCLNAPLSSNANLTGKVMVPEGTLQAKDLTGQALPDATVNIIDLSTGEIIATTTTDAAGNYQVFVPAGGPYVIEAEKNGLKILEITPQLEEGIEYDLGTADCNTTAVALIVKAMLDEGENLADIICEDIEANQNFTEVMTIVCNTVEAGGDPTTSSTVEQAVEDFFNPPSTSPSPPPTPTPTPTYSVTYDGNGHTDGTVPTDANTYESTEEVTVLGNTGSLVKMQDGISLFFEGWNISADGSGNGGTDYKESDTFDMGDENITLYAQWSVLKGTGPAGGWIFYDKGSVSDGWRYLEAAPNDQTSRVWGTYNHTVPGADGMEIGNGQQNTLDIIAGDSLANKAADECADYSIVNGGVTYDDWFLPSKDELSQIYMNLKAEGVGGFSDNFYWSSSEVGSDSAWCRDFGNGSQSGGAKNNTGSVRAVRNFRSTSPTYVINYNANEATVGSAPSDVYHYEPGESVTVLGNMGSLVKDGYVFDGWNTAADGGGTDYAAGSSFAMGNANMILYAKWNLPVHNITKDTYFSTIEAAITAAVEDDEIVVSPGTYEENIEFDNKNISLKSLDPLDPAIVAATIIDGGGDTDSVVRCIGGDSSTINGFTIRNGNTSYGGGIYINNVSAPSITNNVITNNNATNDGGGVFVFDNSTPTIEDNTINCNEASYGGGIYVSDESYPIIINNNITNNIAGEGGGIFVIWAGSSADIKNNTIDANSATVGNGGGICVGPNAVLVEDNTISNNSANGNGGGIYAGQWATLKPTGDRPTGWGGKENIPVGDTLVPAEGIHYNIAGNVLWGNTHGNPLDYSVGAHVSFY